MIYEGVDFSRPLRFIIEDTGLNRHQIEKIRYKIKNKKTYGFEDHIKEIKSLLSEIDKSEMTIKQKVDFILEDLRKDKRDLLTL